MAVRDAGALLQVDAQRGAEQRRFDVVGSERVAGEEDIDEAGLDQGDHGRRRAGVDDRRPADPQQLQARLLDLTHLQGDLADQQRLRLLTRHLRRHEAEGAVGDLGGRWQRDLDPGRAADDGVAGRHVGDRHGVHPAVADPQAAVHLGVRHDQPGPAEPDRGLQVGGGIEIVGEDAVARGLAGHRLAGVDLVDPMGLHPHQQPLQQVVVGRADHHPGVGLVLVLRPQIEAVDAVVPAVLQHVVDDPGQHAGVHQVTADLDDLGVGRRR